MSLQIIIYFALQFHIEVIKVSGTPSYGVRLVRYFIFSEYVGYIPDYVNEW